MLEYTQLEIIIKLGKASEFRDNETGKHIERIVGIMVEEIEMSREEKVMMRYVLEICISVLTKVATII